jgi:methylenetetrahydrofolate dehydrogenase (NADP+)/methenyltetrahydrofolate cyclohydrolase
VGRAYPEAPCGFCLGEGELNLMIIDGRKIADDVREMLRKSIPTLPHAPVLGFIRTGDDLIAKKFVDMKSRAALALGIEVKQYLLEANATTQEALALVAQAAKESDGVLVQMPLSKTIDAEAVLASVPIEKDVDAMGERSGTYVLTPVVAAIEEILARENISVSGKKAIVVGAGRLVGAPAAAWLSAHGAEVKMLTRESGDIENYTKDADILVLGAGVPGILKPSMIKEGVIILDAGTSESEGAVSGDADPACAERASLFTPVPGGIGPITVVMIFKNLFELNKNHVR